MKKLILFQGDSITDAHRDRNDPQSMGQGYASLVAATMGVDYPADKLTYSVTQTGEPEGCISIVANYSSVPMMVILR